MPLLIWAGLLILFWIFAIYSVSIYESFQLTLRLIAGWTLSETSNYFYFFRQLQHLGIALLIGFIVTLIPIDMIKNNQNKIFIATFFLQLLVFTWLGTTFNWARWWIYITGIWTLQPSEFFKLGFVLFLSWWLLRKQKILWTFQGYISLIVVFTVFLLVYLLIPDLWTLLVLWWVILVMYWYGGGKIQYILVSIILWLAIMIPIWMQFDYIKKRIDYFINPEIDKTHQWVWWQTKQWLTAIWWWWFLWKWYWKWLQKFGFIPEAQSDFIFAAFSEEIWFLWNTVLLWLYFFIIYISIMRLKSIRDPYLQNVVVWIISLIWIQTFINIWVNTNILPLTWLTLPFISYWWSSLMVNIIEISLLYKILYKWK